MFFWGQKGRFDLLGRSTQRITPTTETRFWMHWAKIHASQGKLWMHWRNQKIQIKKHSRVQLHPYAHPTPIFGGHYILRLGSDCEPNHTCQISSETVQGFRSLRGPKMTIPIYDLAHRPYNSVRTNALHSDNRVIVNKEDIIARGSMLKQQRASEYRKIVTHKNLQWYGTKRKSRKYIMHHFLTCIV